MRPLKRYWHRNDGDRSVASEIVQIFGARSLAYEDQNPVDETDRGVSSMREAGRAAKQRHPVQGHMHQELEVSRIGALVGSHAVVQLAIQEATLGSEVAQKRFD